LLSSDSSPHSSAASSTAAAAADLDVAGALERLGSDFASARMDIEDAVESVGSTYYPGDVDSAQQSVRDTIGKFNALQDALTSRGREDEARRIRESWGLRLEQLKAELDAAVAAGGADH
jgi:hypothetical protein